MFLGRHVSLDLPLNRLNCLDHSTLCGTIAFGGERDLAAQHGLDRRQRDDFISLPHVHATVGATDSRAYLGLIANSASTALTAGA